MNKNVTGTRRRKYAWRDEYRLGLTFAREDEQRLDNHRGEKLHVISTHEGMNTDRGWTARERMNKGWKITEVKWKGTTEGSGQRAGINSLWRQGWQQHSSECRWLGEGGNQQDRWNWSYWGTAWWQERCTPTVAVFILTSWCQYEWKRSNWCTRGLMNGKGLTGARGDWWMEKV